MGVGSAIGVGYALLGNEVKGRAIEPEEPNDDGEASLGEFHHILENAGAENGRLDVTEFRYFSEEDVIHVSYESQASEEGDNSFRRQHLREVGQVIAMFSEYVAQGGDQGKVVQTQIEQAGEITDLPDGYFVWREWVRKYEAGEWNDSRIINRVLESEYTDNVTTNGN